MTRYEDKLFPRSIQYEANKMNRSNYQVKQQEGIGFVVIVECFEKVTKTSSAYFTFFDIATKKIIMSTYYETARAGGTGLTNFWGSGLNETFYYYLDEVYKKQLKAK